MRTKQYFWLSLTRWGFSVGANWRKRKEGEVHNPLHTLGMFALAWLDSRFIEIVLPFRLMGIFVSDRDWELERAGLLVSVGLFPNVGRREGEWAYRFTWTRRPHPQEAHA